MRNTINRAQRSFVVEYKSDRRKSKPGVKSIWGDMDLKALVRDVAADMPVSKPTSDAAVISRPDSPDDVIAREIELRPLAPVTMKESDAPKITREANGVPGETSETQNVSDQTFEGKSKRKTGPRTIVKITKPPAKPASKVPTQLPASFTTFSDDEILSILEMENRRLKELLVEKLRAENTQLKRMLQRFKVRTP